MDRAAMIDKLNEILKWEYAGLIQYTQYSFLVRGTWRQVYAEFFRAEGEEALEHAHKIGDKIAALGGVTTVERGEVKVTTDLLEMLSNSLEMERHHVALYTEAVQMCEDRDVGLRNLLEDICQMEQDTADHLSKILEEQDLALGAAPRAQQRTG
ncbi:ferritin-like domain-containing protein [Tautonia sociabilis]|uniref:Ferritin n=1 Tax=Tautonia sociabilis TaxID=2080755 RepID=A0A432MP94_9BACT|nr:ferritin-like domain-containing protein [Tautonia sociabilis]RUL88915.1 ferritin [Tautonia sociabilis]